MPGIEPGAFHMQSERSTTELHPLPILRKPCVPIYHWATSLGGGIKPDPVFHLTTSPGGGRQPVSYKFINPDHWGGGGSCCFAPVARQVSICVVCCSATYSFNYNTNITIWIFRIFFFGIHDYLRIACVSTSPQKMPKVFTNPENNRSLKRQKMGITGDAGDWTRGLSHAKRTLYHWATSPVGGIKPCGPIYRWATSPCGGRQPLSYKFNNPDRLGGSCCFELYAPVSRQVSICVYKYFTIWIRIPCICIFHEFYLSPRCSYCLHLGKQNILFRILDCRVCRFSSEKPHVFTNPENCPIVYVQKKMNSWRCRGLNPGPFTCKANALPLSYIPFLY